MGRNGNEANKFYRNRQNKTLPDEGSRTLKKWKSTTSKNNWMSRIFGKISAFRITSRSPVAQRRRPKRKNDNVIGCSPMNSWVLFLYNFDRLHQKTPTNKRCPSFFMSHDLGHADIHLQTTAFRINHEKKNYWSKNQTGLQKRQLLGLFRRLWDQADTKRIRCHWALCKLSGFFDRGTCWRSF